MSQRQLRSKSRVNYAAMLEGDDDEEVFHESFSELSPQDDREDYVELLREELERARKENKLLEKEDEIESMRRELEHLKLKNERLQHKSSKTEKREGGVPVVERVRSDTRVSKAVDKTLQQYALYDSSGEESEDDDDISVSGKNKRGKKARSGRTAKISNRVVQPQIWPHSELSLSYVSKNLDYDDLSLPEFVAGYTAILSHRSLSSREKDARIEHLNALMYLATQFPWRIVRAYHEAVLCEIECGRAKWGDSFNAIENRFMHDAHAEQ